MTTETKKPAKWVDEVTLIPMGANTEPFPITPAILFTLLKISADAIALHTYVAAGRLNEAHEVSQVVHDSMMTIPKETKQAILDTAIASTTVDIFSGDEPQIIMPESTLKH